MMVKCKDCLRLGTLSFDAKDVKITAGKTIDSVWRKKTITLTYCMASEISGIDVSVERNCGCFMSRGEDE